MALLIKNKTASDIEIDDLGITVPANGLYDLSDDHEHSVELDSHISGGTVVFMNDADPENLVEMSTDESVKTAKAASGVDLTAYYRKDEIDTLVAPKANSDSVYSKSVVYTKTEIDSIIDGIVNGAPDVLDTINELAAALGDDANFATTVTNQLAQKAPINHTHHDLYYQKSEIDSSLNGKADSNHDHDGVYSPVNHGHSDYAAVNHHHNGDYAHLGHNHDSAYAPSGHNHDGAYAPLDHQHDGRYYTETEVDAKFNALKFGRNYAYAEALSASTTSSTSWATKLTLNVTITEAGYYRLGFNYSWNGNSTSRDFRGQVIQWIGNNGDFNILNDHRQEPKDTSGSFGSTGSDQKHPVAGFKRIQLQPGTHTFTIDYATSQNSYAASIFDAKLEFWRVE